MNTLREKKHKKIERELHISHLKGCKESETENRMGFENLLQLENIIDEDTVQDSCCPSYRLLLATVDANQTS